MTEGELSALDEKEVSVKGVSTRGPQWSKPLMFDGKEKTRYRLFGLYSRKEYALIRKMGSMAIIKTLARIFCQYTVHVMANVCKITYKIIKSKKPIFSTCSESLFFFSSCGF